MGHKVSVSVDDVPLSFIMGPFVGGETIHYHFIVFIRVYIYIVTYTACKAQTVEYNVISKFMHTQFYIQLSVYLKLYNIFHRLNLSAINIHAVLRSTLNIHANYFML